MDVPYLLTQLSGSLDSQLTNSLVAEFVDMERRFAIGDWEPATLDGGQFAEVASRIVYHVDSANLNRRKSVNACLKYIEDPSQTNSHAFPGRRTALHLCRVIRTIYKFRSQRGAVHIDPAYTANEIDSTMLIACVRWTMAELLRIFWNGPTSDIASVVKEIVTYEVPAVFTGGDNPLVIRTDLTAEEEIIIHLHQSGSAGMTRSEIGDAIPKASSTISNSLSTLASASRREIVRTSDARYLITPAGSKRVHSELADKLSLP